MIAQVMVQPSIWVESGITIKKVRDVYLFKFTDALQARLDYLAERKKSDILSAEEEAELTGLDNLALACQRCNSNRYNFTTVLDPQTQTMVPLFNPRTQRWAEHFVWTADGLSIVKGAQIAGMQPAPPQGLGTRLWIVPIAPHMVGPGSAYAVTSLGCNHRYSRTAKCI